MSKKQQLEQLSKMLKWKKGNKFYADKLKISEKEVEGLLKELNGDDEEPDVGESTFTHNLEKNEIKVSKIWQQSPTPEEVINEHKIDSTKWKMSQFWIKQTLKGYLTSAAFVPRKSSDLSVSDFKEILKSVKPLPRVIKVQRDEKLPKVNIILPKQDAHLNKFDIHGSNNIEERFRIVEDAVEKVVRKAQLGNLIDKVTYIVGSDQFNSEWTNTTTKGTKQENILTYQEAFKKIGEHESGIINFLLENSNMVDVLFIPGNHDEFVGWHLVNWLQALFSSTKRVRFDTSPLNRKYEKYGNSAIMFNHGDAMAAKDLAYKFPIEFRSQWSSCQNYYCFLGDKHREVSTDIHGIKFYQVPALSTAKSSWDDKQGHTCNKAEMVAFLITEERGMTDIYRQTLN